MHAYVCERNNKKSLSTTYENTGEKQQQFNVALKME